MSSSWQLRRATPADLDAIMALETSIFTTDAWSPATMSAELVGEHGYYLVAHRVDATDANDSTDATDAPDAADAPDTIEGYAGLLAPRGAEQADIQTIAVAETARRHRIGRTLVAALVKEASARGAREVFLEVRADNPGAQALYREFGFEQIGVRQHYYQPDDVAAIVMRASLASGNGTARSGAGTADSGNGTAPPGTETARSGTETGQQL
jgi:[ribosomal protein S18]-alanine N-acetyltransferase